MDNNEAFGDYIYALGYELAIIVRDKRLQERAISWNSQPDALEELPPYACDCLEQGCKGTSVSVLSNPGIESSD